MQPTQQDVQLVAQSMGQPTPTPVPAPTPATEPQQVQQPVQPISQDPAPQQPAPQVAQTVEGVQGAPQIPQPIAQEPVSPQPFAQEPVQQPHPVQQPEQQIQPQPQQPAQQSYEDYVNQALAQIGQPTPEPDLKNVDLNSDEAVENWFKEFKTSIIDTVNFETKRKETIANIERNAWDEAFTQYPDLKGNKQVIDAVMNYRVGAHNRGIYLSPVQAAQQLFDSMGRQYQRGVIDNQVHTTIEQVQPNAGSSNPPVAQTMANPQDELAAVRDGGEVALMQVLQGRISNGQL